MSYDKRLQALLPVGTVSAQSLTATGNASYIFHAQRACDVESIMAEITTATVSNVTIVVACSIATAASAYATTVSLPTLSIPTGATVGQVYFKNVPIASPAAVTPGSNYGQTPAQFRLLPGDRLTFNVQTAAGGGGAAGAAVFMVDVSEAPEAQKLQANMVASA